jgi:hypothetical protein
MHLIEGPARIDYPGAWQQDPQDPELLLNESNPVDSPAIQANSGWVQRVLGEFIFPAMHVAL